ncbi:O-antigen ligase family protein [Pedobacter sp. MC2016-15]|uniref:O-antigen ligase family protein n=1 Tax=Pedobacter sp. MC2016-15 TaxID=2994473 RepID=UPI0022466724|nr:O-antigen ligase family protein [Pedobacter sp. MC2016-15]MCX2477731.1 O-antigen ligase family protein [Pedobacter sp. MC2016-15]
MKIDHLLSLAAVSLFAVLMVLSKDRKRDFLIYVLYLFPVMDLAVTPVEWGRLRVFEVVCYLSLPFTFAEVVLIKRREGFNLYYWLFGFFVLAVLFGSLHSRYVKSSLFSMLSIFPVFIYTKSLITECLDNRQFQLKVIRVLKVVAIFSVVFLAAQLLMGLKFTFYPSLNRNTALEGVIRYPGFFQDPQMYGQYLVMICFLFLLNVSNIRRPDWRNYGLFFLMVTALLLTGGRSALLGIAVGMALLFFIFDSQYKFLMMSIAGLGVFAFLSLSESLTIFNRVDTLNEDYLFRAAIWDEAAVIFQHNTWLGVGFGNYKWYNMDFSTNYMLNESNEIVFFGYGQPESGYWMLLTELGLTGFIITCLFILHPVLNSIKKYLSGENSPVVFLFIASILGFLVTFISAYSLNDRRILIVVITLLTLLIVQNTRSTQTYEESI